jgi:hypothetical protein
VRGRRGPYPLDSRAPVSIQKYGAISYAWNWAQFDPKRIPWRLCEQRRVVMAQLQIDE